MGIWVAEHDPKPTTRVRRSGHHTSWEQSLSPRRGLGARMKQMKQERHLREVYVLQTELRLVIGPGIRKLIPAGGFRHAKQST